MTSDVKQSLQTARNIIQSPQYKNGLAKIEQLRQDLQLAKTVEAIRRIIGRRDAHFEPMRQNDKVLYAFLEHELNGLNTKITEKLNLNIFYWKVREN